MSLTDEEKQIVTTTWAMVAKNLNQAGVDLFIKLFEQNPSYQNFFSFRDVPDLVKLREDKRLKAHVRNVMFNIAMVVDNLDDPEVLQEMVDKIARSHIRRKLSEVHFEKLKYPLVEVLTESLGAEVMNEQALAAWSKTYDLFTNALVSQAKAQAV